MPILNDLAASADRTFQIQLDQLSGGAVPGPTQNLTVTILDMTGMQPHAFSRMQLLPDRCLELTLEGGVHSRYQSFFDLYSVETSADLDQWQTWRTLERTGAAGRHAPLRRFHSTWRGFAILPDEFRAGDHTLSASHRPAPGGPDHSLHHRLHPPEPVRCLSQRNVQRHPMLSRSRPRLERAVHGCSTRVTA